MNVTLIRDYARLKRRSIPWMTQWLGATSVGLLAVLLTWLSDSAWEWFRHLQTEFYFLPLLLTPSCFVVVLWLTKRFFQGAEGSGIPQVIAAVKSTSANQQSALGWRALLGKLLLCPLILLGGGSIGREGPTVQVGAAAMQLLSSRFKSISFKQRQTFVLAGGAAGVAAAFNTPLAGVVFAIEELSRSFEQRTSGAVILGVVFAGMVSIAFFGNYTYFGKLQLAGLPILYEQILIVAVISGLAGGFFSRCTLSFVQQSAGIFGQWRQRFPYRFALVCGVVVALLGLLGHGGAHGTGYEQAAEFLAGEQQEVFGFGLIKMAATFASFAAGIPAGIFAPSLSIGAGLGSDVAHLFGAEHIALLAVIGMVSYLAAVTQAPLTAFVIVMEMTAGQSILLGLMLAALIGANIGRLISPRLYDALSAQFSAADNTNIAPRPETSDRSNNANQI